ncbi:MAG: GlsB/YeaQ/YmgE family stress response membrane protein [Planctomycetota bacterium]
MLGNVIGWCLFGLFAGAVAKLLMPGGHRLGCAGTMGLGVLGSLTTGALFHALFAESNDGFQPAGFIGSVIGGMVVLWLARKLK